MFRPLLCLIATLATCAALHAKDVDPNPKSLEVPAETDLKAKELIRTLSKASFAEREQAHRERRVQLQLHRLHLQRGHRRGGGGRAHGRDDRAPGGHRV